MGGGSIRIHDSELQRHVFEKVLQIPTQTLVTFIFICTVICLFFRNPFWMRFHSVLLRMVDSPLDLTGTSPAWLRRAVLTHLFEKSSPSPKPRKVDARCFRLPFIRIKKCFPDIIVPSIFHPRRGSNFRKLLLVN